MARHESSQLSIAESRKVRHEYRGGGCRDHLRHTVRRARFASSPRMVPDNGRMTRLEGIARGSSASIGTKENWRTFQLAFFRHSYTDKADKTYWTLISFMYQCELRPQNLSFFLPNRWRGQHLTPFQFCIRRESQPTNIQPAQTHKSLLSKDGKVQHDFGLHVVVFECV